MKRHQKLQDLSREHYSALKLALQAKRAALSGDPREIESATTACVTSFRLELDPHFLVEEQTLLPILLASGEHRVVQRVEADYNNQKAQEMSLSASSRQARQNLILTREEEASKFQEEIFGQDGTLMKKRIELIQPIQKRVFDAIANYAAQNGYELVLDAASNPTLLYNSEKIDHTQALIEFMKK